MVNYLSCVESTTKAIIHKEDEKKKKKKKKYGSKKRVHGWYVNGKTTMAIQPTSLSPILDVS